MMRECIPPIVSLSIVSHAQLNLVSSLLDDLRLHCNGYPLEILLTLNVAEKSHLYVPELPFKLHVLRNVSPQGFGSNHNHAFKFATGQYFCVLNPDIRLQDNPFPALINASVQHQLGVCAPLVLSPSDEIEDSARYFPNPFTLFGKALRMNIQTRYPIVDQITYPDWVAGMFMLFLSSAYQSLHGFDEKYFLYYEDVDICGRLYLSGKKVGLVPAVRVVHAAQRASHMNFRFFFIHLRSALTFFMSARYLRILWNKWHRRRFF